MRIFYGLFAFTCGSDILHFLKESNFAEASWQWPLRWLAWFPGSSETILTVIFFATLITQLLSSIYIYNRTLKFIAWLGFGLLAAARVSFGNFSYNLLAFFLCAFCLAFVTSSKEGSSKEEVDADTRFYLWAAQVVFLLTYTLSGIWKARGFIASVGQSGGLSVDPIYYHIVSYRLQFFDASSPSVVLPPLVGLILWMGVILFESVSVFVAFNPKIQPFWGVGIILMHVGSALTMNLYYATHLLLATVLLICHPYTKRRKTKES